MARRKDNLLSDLAQLPWQVSVCLAVVAFVALRFVLPEIDFKNPSSRMLSALGYQLSWAAFIFLIPAATSAFNSNRKRNLLDRQSGIESIRSLSWKEFEELMGEAYRRRGFEVRENPNAGPDGGVDLVLRKDGRRRLVQCKQWKNRKVGVKVVREMFGIMKAEGADSVTVAISGAFTKEAVDFALANSMELVDGDQLLKLLKNVQQEPAIKEHSSPELFTKYCSQCCAKMVLRKAKRGSNAGAQFWGCSNYPKCKHTEVH